MKIRFTLTGGAIALGLLIATAINAQATTVTFSIDIGSATPAAPDTILGDPGGAGPAVPVIPSIGFAETDAFTYGHVGMADESRLFFSVDRASTGAPGTAVASEAAGGAGGPGDHPADVFSSMGGGMNTLVWDGNGAPNPGLAPNLGLIEPFGLPGDNLDGLDMRTPGPMSSIFWSVDPGTIAGSPPYAGFSAADIYISPVVPGYSGSPSVWASELMLGLLVGDDIDALEIIEDGAAGFTAGDIILFSLAPGSPTLGALGFGPGTGGASVLGVGGGFGPAPTVFIPEFLLGLAPTDNIDAIALMAIPEPGRGLLLGLSFVTMLLRRRR